MGYLIVSLIFLGFFLLSFGFFVLLGYLRARYDRATVQTAQFLGGCGCVLVIGFGLLQALGNALGGGGIHLEGILIFVGVCLLGRWAAGWLRSRMAQKK